MLDVAHMEHAEHLSIRNVMYYAQLSIQQVFDDALPEVALEARAGIHTIVHEYTPAIVFYLNGSVQGFSPITLPGGEA